MLSRGQFQATVIANLPVCREHYRLVLRIPQFPSTQPGQFIQILCSHEPGIAQEIETEWRIGADNHWLEPQAMLRRPFSLAGRIDTADGVELVVIHRVVGIGTAWLANLSAGGSANILGPL